MWQRFSEASRQVILNGQGFAMEMGHASTDSGHLFLGVIKDLDDNSRIAALLKLSGVQLEEARLYARSSVADTPTGSDEPKLTASARRVMEYAADEAKRDHSEFIEVEHFFIGCVRTQGGPHVGEVLRPLGLDAEKLREHLKSLDSSAPPYREEGLLNRLTESGFKAIEAAHESMRSSFNGRISTAHLLLGVLANEQNRAVRILLMADINIEDLRVAAKNEIISDGQIATPQKKFTPAVKRALERANREAVKYNQSFIGPQHLLYALLPKPTTIAENLAFGNSLDDPLEKVWQSFPVQEIQRAYEERRAAQPELSPKQRPGSRGAKAHSARKRDQVIATTFLVLGAMWTTIIGHGPPTTGFSWFLGLAGMAVFLVLAMGACLMMVFGKSARLKNLWLNSFALYLLGMFFGMFLSKI